MGIFPWISLHISSVCSFFFLLLYLFNVLFFPNEFTLSFLLLLLLCLFYSTLYKNWKKKRKEKFYWQTPSFVWVSRFSVFIRNTVNIHVCVCDYTHSCWLKNKRTKGKQKVEYITKWRGHQKPARNITHMHCSNESNTKNI